MEMGFNREAARQALMDNNNNLEVALNSLLTGSSGSRPGSVLAESNKPQPRGSYTHRNNALCRTILHASTKLAESKKRLDNDVGVPEMG